MSVSCTCRSFVIWDWDQEGIEGRFVLEQIWTSSDVTFRGPALQIFTKATEFDIIVVKIPPRSPLHVRVFNWV